MAHDHAAPVPPRALFVLRGGTGDAVPEASPATVPVPVEASTGDGTGSTEVQPVPASVPMTVPERACLAGKHWADLAANGAGQLWLNPGRLGHSLYHGKPGSLAEHRAYIKSRAWVPPELDGKAAKVIGGAGVVFYTIAGLLQIPLLILYVALDRALRLAGLTAFLIFISLIVPRLI